MNYIKKFLAITLIFVMQFQSVHASVAIGGGWSLNLTRVENSTNIFTAFKNGFQSTVAISPSSAQVAKSLLRGGLVGLALSAVTQALLDGIDYVMDSAKQELRYKYKNPSAHIYYGLNYTDLGLRQYVINIKSSNPLDFCKAIDGKYEDMGSKLTFKYYQENQCYYSLSKFSPPDDVWPMLSLVKITPEYPSIPLTTLATQIINLAEQGNPDAKAYITSVVQDMLEHDEDYRKSLEAQLDAKLQEAQSIGSNNGNNNNGGNSNSGNNSATKPVPSTSGNSTTANPTPPNNDDEHKFKRPNENLEKGDRIDLSTFVKGRYEGQNVFIDPKTRYMIIRDRAGANSHGGSFWKLLDKTGRRVATLAEDGRVLRK